MSDARNFTAVARGAERYIFIWDDSPLSAEQILRAVGRMASEPTLGFDWNNALRVADEVRRLMPNV